VPGVRDRWGADVTRFDVPLTSLDHFSAERRVVPDLVKIDVEGGEIGVVHGARGLLASARPIVIFESWRSAPQRHEIFGLFAGLRYTLHEVVVDRRAKILPYARFLTSPATNFVAQPPGRARARVAAER
jgi:hypothetical protein